MDRDLVSPSSIIAVIFYCSITTKLVLMMLSKGNSPNFGRPLMATKAEVLADAMHGCGCLGRASDDEPVFVLRAQDTFFVPLVRLWIELVENAAPLPGIAEAKLMDAIDIANAGVDWQRRCGAKVPD
jgi:hypothetical protein